jgi:predicted GNAT family acetyltransferase
MIVKVKSNEHLHFCISYWLRQYKTNSQFAKSICNEVYYDEHRKRAMACLNINAVIYSDPKSPDHFIGFLCGIPLQNKNILHYVYVKKAFRGHGVARAMFNHVFKPKDEIIITHQGDIMGLKNNHNKLTFNPYIFMGVHNEENN